MIVTYKAESSKVKCKPCPALKRYREPVPDRDTGTRPGRFCPKTVLAAAERPFWRARGRCPAAVKVGLRCLGQHGETLAFLPSGTLSVLQSPALQELSPCPWGRGHSLTPAPLQVGGLCSACELWTEWAATQREGRWSSVLFHLGARRRWGLALGPRAQQHLASARVVGGQ